MVAMIFTEYKNTKAGGIVKVVRVVFWGWGFLIGEYYNLGARNCNIIG